MDEITSEGCGITELRAAIQGNQIIFPVPVPIFVNEHRADMQWRLVELYFIHGWSPVRLADRYRVTTSRVRQSLRSWVDRARAMGYLQPVPLAEDIRPALVMTASASFASGAGPAFVYDMPTPGSTPPDRHFPSHYA